jgi:hypothetical protein
MKNKLAFKTDRSHLSKDRTPSIQSHYIHQFSIDVGGFYLSGQDKHASRVLARTHTLSLK